MSKFVSGVSDLIAKERSMAMLKNDMNIDCPVIHAQWFEREKLEERSTGTKRYRIGEDNSSQERFFGTSSSKVSPKCGQKRVCNPKPKRGSNSESVLLSPTCATCGKKRHDDKCIAGTKGCYGCGGSDHKMRSCPILKARGIEGKRKEEN
ncbi:hypothetical protein MTR67_033976 [Solanum verrucosum]|uniref:CCHC-type domain-containing protein n=1 Tax=Solanum verrucosum TaxID=315347 RepID=A0AAF0ZI42_SOLVR|nr:hypothetical protein MTR67_033976 [Solanum verrucosum]